MQPPNPNVGLDKVAKVDELLMSRLKKDTYQQRRKDGRPVHSMNSIGILVLASMAWLLQVAALSFSNWRQDWKGMFFSTTTRGWGLFTVSGRETLSWHTFQARSCLIWGQLNTFAACGSPICQWYELKCRVYYDMMRVNYACAVLFVVELVIHAACIVLTARMKPRTLYWASVWWWVVVFMHLIVLLVHWMLMEELFGQLTAESFYPDPDFGVAFIASVFSLFFLFFIAGLGFILSATWPMQSLASDSEEDSDSDDSGNERRQRRAVRRNRRKNEGKKKFDDSSSEDLPGLPPSSGPSSAPMQAPYQQAPYQQAPPVGGGGMMYAASPQAAPSSVYGQGQAAQYYSPGHGY